jgi:DNA replication and repair protein RecF|tara:strand:- start:700 stop:1803 length:1104 start_codon:yes stop_codon:yes gene_type:complete
VRIKSLSLEKFRSFQELSMDFKSANIHVLLGPNGAGKTNILESISVLSETKSFLGSQEIDLVNWGEEYTRVKAKLKNDQSEISLIEVVSQIAPRKQKACFINDVKLQLSDAVGHLPTVAFLPQDLELFAGSPQVRRKFLDSLLSQVSPEYSKALSQYTKILKQRNSLLRKIAEGVAKRGDLKQWDQMLSDAGSILILKRLELIEVFQCTLLQEFNTLGEEWSSAELKYKRKGSARTEDDLACELQDLLEHYQERDIMLQSTTVGPHRDDWFVEADGRELTTFASRGQQRAAVLALIFLKVSFLEIRRGEKPVVLLDDVFSELDDNHQRALLKCFDDYQVIISATHVPTELEGAKVWEVGEQVQTKVF